MFDAIISLKFSLLDPEKQGALQDVSTCLEGIDVSIRRLKSTKNPDRGYDFYLQCKCCRTLLPLVQERLKAAGATDVKVERDDWFPRTKKDLDILSHKVFEGGKELKADHPAFKNPEYRQRRKYFAGIATEYKHGQPIPRVKYTQAEVETWGTVYNELTELHRKHACKEYNSIFTQLVEKCGYGPDNIPQLEDVSNFLQACTGFQLRPAAGLLSPRDFLAGFAFRVYYCTQYIRHTPSYNPEPDVCHELMGHVPMLSDPTFAHFAQEIGLASLGASEEIVEQLSKLFWFTAEFGICKEDGKQKIYGAGLLSSPGELNYFLGGDVKKPKIRPLNASEASKQEYQIDEYQEVYFQAESFNDAIDQTLKHVKTIPRPHTICSDSDTQEVTVHPPHHKFDEKYPKVCFFGDAHHEVVTTEGQAIKWEDIGVTIDIPPGAVSEQATTDVSVWPCLSGPFEIPDGIDLASPFYLATAHGPRFKFTQGIKLSLQHFINLKTPEDCKEMVFLSAPSTPSYTRSKPTYLFREIQKGTFTVGSQVATIFAEHFCFVCIGRRRLFWRHNHHGGNRYSARLYWDWDSLSGGQETTFAIFAVSLCHKVLTGNLEQLMEQEFGTNLKHTIQEPIYLSEKEEAVYLNFPKNIPGWKISADRNQKISRSELDLPLQEPEYAQDWSSGYPPKIRLTISRTSACEQMETGCKLQVLGHKEKADFYLPLMKTRVSSTVPSACQSRSLREQTRKRKQDQHHTEKSTRKKPSVTPEIQADVLEAVSPPSSEDAVRDVDQLGEESFLEITDYLQGLDRINIYQLGLVLGLSDGRVRMIQDSKTFLEDVINLWLQKVDQVQEKGAPSWWRLVDALRNRRIKQNGIANDIAKDKNIK